MAAATTSLPETPGGSRNWDYRYTWIRDGVCTLAALQDLGFRDEAHAFLGFIADRLDEAPLQVMYGIGGELELPESTLDHLDGLRGRPTRAHRQRCRPSAAARHVGLAGASHRAGPRGSGTPRWTTGPGPSCTQLAAEATAHWRSAGPGHLGDPWRAPALRLLEAHGLGGPGPVGARRGAARRPGGRRRGGGPRRPPSTTTSLRNGVDDAGRLHPDLRRTRAGRLDAAGVAHGLPAPGPTRACGRPSWRSPTS